MMNVSAVGFPRRYAGDGPSQDGEYQIAQREQKEKQRAIERDSPAPAPKNLHGKGAERKSEERCPGISHKNPRGRAIVGEKSDADAGQGRTKRGILQISAKRRENQQRKRRNCRASAGKTVQSVDEIHGIGQRGQPEHAQKKGEQLSRMERYPTERKGADAAAQQGGENGGCELNRQFHRRRQPEAVVQNSQR